MDMTARMLLHRYLDGYDDPEWFPPPRLQAPSRSHIDASLQRRRTQHRDDDPYWMPPPRLRPQVRTHDRQRERSMYDDVPRRTPDKDRVHTRSSTNIARRPVELVPELTPVQRELQELRCKLARLEAKWAASPLRTAPEFVATPTESKVIAMPLETEFVAMPPKLKFTTAPSETTLIVNAPTEEPVATPSETTPTVDAPTEKIFFKAPSEPTFHELIEVSALPSSSPLLFTEEPLDAPPTEKTIIATPAEDAMITAIPEQVSLGTCSLLFTEEPDATPSPGTESYFIKFEVPRVGALPKVIYMLQSTRRLPLAPPTSKRGRFDSKGRRVMRPSPDPNRVQARPVQPRPWRPPWLKKEEERDVREGKRSANMKNAMIKKRGRTRPTRSTEDIVQESIPRVLQVNPRVLMFNAFFCQSPDIHGNPGLLDSFLVYKYFI